MESKFKKLPVLLVDGNYFGHRAVHGLNKGGNFSLDTTLEMLQFEDALYDQLIGLYKSFNNDYHTLISNIVFVFDGYSWRKDIPPHKPYYIEEHEPIGYKENRVENERDNINWDNWRICLTNFAERIQHFLAVFKTEGAEGDDALLLLTNYLCKQGIMSIIFCTDGDLKQLINELVIVYRNTKSTEFPDGEIVISKDLAKLYYSDVSAMDKLMGRGGMLDSDRQWFTNLFKLQINGGAAISTAKRTLNNGISIPNYKTDAFVKCICGDKKDNIFPIFRWKSNGVKPKNMKVTEAMMVKALKPHGIELNDDSLELMLSDTEDGKELFLNLLLGLQHNTKQVGISKNVTLHYKHNTLLNILKVENIPSLVIEIFNKKLKENLVLVNRTLEIGLLYSNNQKRNIDDVDIIKNSISHLPTNNQTEIQTTKTSSDYSEIDDILNS